MPIRGGRGPLLHIKSRHPGAEHPGADSPASSGTPGCPISASGEAGSHFRQWPPAITGRRERGLDYPVPGRFPQLGTCGQPNRTQSLMRTPIVLTWSHRIVSIQVYLYVSFSCVARCDGVRVEFRRPRVWVASRGFR